METPATWVITFSDGTEEKLYGVVGKSADGDLEITRYTSKGVFFDTKSYKLTGIEKWEKA